MVFNSNDNHYQLMANAIRALTMDAVEKANSGHPGMPMGMADVATVLFKEFLKFNPLEPNWPDRDRFILSAGHGSMLLYSLLYLTGYNDITLEDIKKFRQLNSKTAGHPEYGYADGIETTTGPLGQGLANAAGMALAECILNTKFGDICNHYTYVIAGDGCLMEGISQETISLAGHLRLSKLIVLFDDNQISIDGPTILSISEDHIARFKACGWHTISIDSHNYQQISAAIEQARNANLPSLIACKTIIGYGAPTKAGKETSHGSPLGTTEVTQAKINLGWTGGQFEVPSKILKLWRDTAHKGIESYAKWQQKFNTSPHKEKFARSIADNLTSNIGEIIVDLKNQLLLVNSEATRKSSGRVLKELVKHFPELIGGSADLTGSNETKTDLMQPITKDNYNGNYIYYGIREHAMAAIMNGMALHKGVIPYGGSFLVFTDYCRPAIRLSALMGIRVIYVMTHDSIGLGEDGPTHQPVEHLISLRAIPNLLVLRPADAIETAECWQIALENFKTPSVISLTRQALPLIRKSANRENMSLKGGYIIAESEHPLAVTILATGSEVHIALEAADILNKKFIGTRVVSMPSIELFNQQDLTYKQAILNNDSIKVAVEAASPLSWHQYIGQNGIFIGMDSFGASGKAEDLYQYFGITAEKIVEKILNKMEKK